MREGVCLRVYLNESDRIEGEPAMQAVLTLCRNAGLSGVSVMRGVEGIGAHGLHTTEFLSLSSNLPLIIEAIDTKERIDTAIAEMRPYLGNHLVATWPVSIIRPSKEYSDE